jgi:hypothetical protein
MSVESSRNRRNVRRHVSRANYMISSMWPQPQQAVAIAPITPDVSRTLSQITLAITTMRDAIAYVQQGLSAESSQAILRRWLPSTARHIEEMMQELNDLQLMRTPMGIELTQALTVVVLSGDMIAMQAQLNDQDVLALFERNADRALRYLRVIDTANVVCEAP